MKHHPIRLNMSRLLGFRLYPEPPRTGTSAVLGAKIGSKLGKKPVR
ncbi:hypothetical protein [Thioalkalivibrio paradoxus]|uniref:Uncharacterized protein n=1 Tax=Thioalkalivibrio paradoxus ARh 1 TaxID=713585 RepID=W0DNT7_9GAMM|nr:hypothetical protein [Thioalkalivibrio paradoxus]AHF00245.1 hypothetical protein THITH_13725 [Thioalkalivibrio paradoxus ARh 1]